MVRLVVATCLLLAVAAILALAAGEPEAEAMTSYIVHVASSHAPRPSRRRALAQAAYYASFLRDHLPTHLLHPTPSVHYSYTHAATGFAARLTGCQAAYLESQPSVLAVVPDAMLQLHTTMTPSFLRLSALSGLLPASNGAMDVVIGVIDTGIYPKGRASFAADPSLPPPPGSFRGGCVSTPSFNGSTFCNNKLVGAKFFYLGYKALNGRLTDETDQSISPLDVNGHGTHTASTAAGSAAAGAGFYNYGKGTAVGVAPNARIAAYKVCWEHGCADSDILAAFDEAIADRVNVISYSIGPVGKVPKLHRDGATVGAFSAVRKGIVVSASAGNAGPGESTVGNIAPWMLTVGASTINRRFPGTVVLGNGDTLNGTSLYVGKPLDATKIALVYGGDVGTNVCEAGKLDKTLVAGKIVLCDHDDENEVAQGEAVKLAGGAGAIFGSTEDSGELPPTSPHILPATTISFAAAKKIKKYISTHSSPTAMIMFHGTVVSRTPSSPRMADFSSRGPNLHAPEILKPDITAPGVDILAAWTGKKSPSSLDSDKRRVKYNIISGTSMSCPHVSGIAALLRQARPDWSPAAIKSAMMTTAYVLDNAGNVIKDTSTGRASTPFVYGAGHVDPNRAVDPGLVYDAGVRDYISFLCALGYTSKEIGIFTRDDSRADYCSTRTGSSGDLNYPAFSAVFHSDMDEVTQRRVVRNVGRNVSATYTARIISPAGVRVTVEPRKLQFTATQQTREYVMTFAPRGDARVTDKYTFGSIVWSDGEHKVTSPIAITWPVSQVAAS
ncbi:hypothetical protein SETIT_1G340300v2 [Setaria italica]|uniref:Subtilisin-like protease n=1 Tax=Setaria italica TaxID=4555 RepID=K3YZJ8_SETIT|nr:subtilisin-like protease SBT1.4 [Setaria italica]RCV08608.1 hypothetical protein SETIT_1G340300v2 [Setaria italica]